MSFIYFLPELRSVPEHTRLRCKRSFASCAVHCIGVNMVQFGALVCSVVQKLIVWYSTVCYCGVQCSAVLYSVVL